MPTLKMAIRGSLQRDMRNEARAAARALTGPVRQVVARGRNYGRRRVRAALGDRFANALRGDTKPRRGNSLTPSGLVHSKAIVKRAGGTHDLFTEFEKPKVIRTLNGTFQLIPDDDHPELRGVSPRAISGLIALPNRGRARRRGRNAPDRAAFRLVRRTNKTDVLWWLVPVVRQKAHLRGLTDGIVRAMERRPTLEELGVRQWDREVAKGNVEA